MSGLPPAETQHVPLRGTQKPGPGSGLGTFLAPIKRAAHASPESVA